MPVSWKTLSLAGSAATLAIMLNYDVSNAQVTRTALPVDRLFDAREFFAPLDRERQMANGRAEALAVKMPSFVPGYSVGVLCDKEGWKLVGKGNAPRTIGSVYARDEVITACSHPVNESLGRKTLMLWRKALATRTPSYDGGFDGTNYFFALQSEKNVGSVWNPSPDKPRLYKLTKVADAMFAACHTGKKFSELERQIGDLIASY